MMVDKLAILVITPLGTALFLGMGALVLAWARHRRLAWWLGLLALLWLWLWSTPVVSTWVAAPLEQRYPPVPIASLPQVQAAVVLGGVISSPSAQRPYADLSSGADRIWHAARIWHARKTPLLLLSGGAAHNPGAVSEAQAMRFFLRDLGVPDDVMIVEEHSANTRQNATMSAALLKQRGITRVLLVTSAMHMPRALALFQAAGLDVVPAATDHETMGPSNSLRLLPAAGALDVSGRALKEWVALAFS